MRIGDGFLLVYSITSRQAFEEIGTLHQLILHIKHQDFVPVIVIASKSDYEYERLVSMKGALTLFLHRNPPILCHPSEGSDLAKRLGCKFLETSAKERTNVDEAFSDLVREVRKYDELKYQWVRCCSCSARP